MQKLNIAGSELTAVIKEISSHGRRMVSKVYQPSEHELWFVFREEKSLRLFTNTKPGTATIFLTKRRIDFPQTPSAFAGLLRKHLLGRRLEKIDKKTGDRLTTLCFGSGGPRLYCRFFGPGGYLLTDLDGNVLGNSGFIQKPPIKIGEKFEPLTSLKEGIEQEADFTGPPSEELEKRYNRSALEKTRTNILSELKKGLKKCKRMKKGLNAEREKLLNYSDCKKWGDACTAYFNKIPKGASSVRLPDPKTGEDMEIPLSPGLSPSVNVKLLYRNYRKYKKGLERIETTLAEQQEKERALAYKVEMVESVSSLDELERYVDKPEHGGGPLKMLSSKGKKASPFRQFFTRLGFEVLIGKNNRQNDELVRKSNGNDLWFHVRDFPGSHAVLKTRGKSDVPWESIMEAAELALKYSSRARDNEGIVIYAHIKNIKKPKKAPPGKVHVTHEKTVSVSLI